MANLQKNLEAHMKKMHANHDFIVKVQKDESKLGAEFVSTFVEEMNKVPASLCKNQKMKAAKGIMKKMMLNHNEDEKKEKVTKNEGGRKRGGRGKKFCKR